MLLPVINWKDLLAGRGLKVVLIGLCAVVGLSGIAVGGYYLWPAPAPKPPPPVESSTFEDASDYAASKDFSRLPMDRRIAWVEAQMRRVDQMDDDEFFSHWKDMDEETRRRIGRNMGAVMRERAKRHALAYSKLPSSERAAFIDGRIDEMQRWRSRGRRMRGQRRRSDRDESDEAHKARHRRGEARMGREVYRFMNDEPADHRAKTISYFTAIGKRRAERGQSRLFGGRRRSK